MIAHTTRTKHHSPRTMYCVGRGRGGDGRGHGAFPSRHHQDTITIMYVVQLPYCVKLGCNVAPDLYPDSDATGSTFRRLKPGWGMM